MSYNYSYPSQSERMVVPPNQATISNSSSSAFDRFGYRHQYERRNEESNCTNYQSNNTHVNYRHPHHLKPTTNRSIVYEPPRWACPGRGDSTLQPIDETALTHPPVDLTIRRYLLIGRSPSSHVPLLHSTSSRRHALLFHHPNGSCYLSDCHSAHGTFVDGVRVKPYPNPPKRLRRGALVRFGGPGAPTFVLKSFSVKLEEMVKDLGGVAEAYFPKPKPVIETPPIICESSSSEEEEQICIEPGTNESQPVQPPVRTKTPLKMSKKTSGGVLACIRGDGGGVACIADGKDAPEAALVLLNTRLNAVGRGAMESEYERRIARSAQAKFENMGMKRKREANEVEESYSIEYKRPNKGILKMSKKTETKTSPVIVNEDCFTPCIHFNNRKKRRRVIFSDEKASDFYAPSVTPDEITPDAEDERVQKLKNTLTLPLL